MVEKDALFMDMALGQARAAAAIGEVPVGAVIVSAHGEMLALGHNRPIATADPTAHAEMEVIRLAAAALENYRLPGTTLYVTLEPCAMCAGAIAMARIARLVFAASDEKGGAVINGGKFFDQPTCHHRPEISHGLMADAASALLQEFFRARR